MRSAAASQACLSGGERGTAKSTAARALAALLPEIEVVADCPFSCDPRGVEAVCDDCRARLARGELLPEALPLVILLTDGAGNIAPSDLPAQEEAWQIADRFRQGRLRALVLNMEAPSHDIGLAQKLAAALGGPCYTLPELNAVTLAQTVREEVRG